MPPCLTCTDFLIQHIVGWDGGFSFTFAYLCFCLPFSPTPRAPLNCENDPPFKTDSVATVFGVRLPVRNRP